MTQRDGGHVAARDIAELAAGARPNAAAAAHIAGCAACRGELARLDPSAVFGLLAALPLPVGVPPAPRLARTRARRRVAARGRVALAAAAAALAVAALWLIDRGGAGVPVVARARAVPPVVARVDSPHARIVTLVPPGDDAPTVTLIVGVEADL